MASAISTAAAAAEPLRVQVIDRETSPRSKLLSLKRVTQPGFKDFVGEILAGIERRIGNYTLVSSPGAPSGLLDVRIVRVPLITSGDRLSHEGDGAVPSASGACSLRSPWMNVSVSNHPRRISGVIFWNERQILQDQALLSGTTKEGAAPRSALPRDEFERLADYYAEYNIRHTPGAQRKGTQQIPADLLWLFRRSPQSTRGPFSVGAQSTMQEIAKSEAAYYAKLTLVLLDQCLQRPGERIRYDSIRDVSRSVELQRYGTD
jgi:hypothetical protein